MFPDKNIQRVDSDNISSKSDLKDFIKKAIEKVLKKKNLRIIDISKYQFKSFTDIKFFGNSFCKFSVVIQKEAFVLLLY